MCVNRIAQRNVTRLESSELENRLKFDERSKIACENVYDALLNWLRLMSSTASRTGHSQEHRLQQHGIRSDA